MSPLDFRSTLGHFCSGIVVVSALNDGVPVGMTCQSFFSLSLDPPLIAFSPAKSSKSYPLIRSSGAFCINILEEAQQALCANFARSGTDKWQQVAWKPGPTGSPVLEGVLAWIDCHLEAEYEAGDHYLVVGRVVGLNSTADNRARPLLYFKGAYSSLQPPEGA